MKKLLILTLAVANLGLLAEQTINLDICTGDITIEDSDTYIVTGTGNITINVIESCTMVLKGCTIQSDNCIWVDDCVVEFQIANDVTLEGSISIEDSSAVTVTGTGCLNLVNKGYFYLDDSSTLTIDGPHFVCNPSKLSTKYFIFDFGQSPATVNINNATIDAADLDCIVQVENYKTSDNLHFNGGSIYNPDNVPFVTSLQPGDDPEPVNKDGNNVYIATLEDACAKDHVTLLGKKSSYEYAATESKSSDPYTTYIGPGHSDTDDLFLPLPNGTYTITGDTGKSYVGEIDGGPATFTSAPEPCCGLLALLAGLGLLRRK